MCSRCSTRKLRVLLHPKLILINVWQPSRRIWLKLVPWSNNRSAKLWRQYLMSDVMSKPMANVFFKGKGCPTCNRVGYRGRRALFELLPSSPEVRSALEQGLPAPEIEKAALASGMVSVRERCLALVKKGITSFDEFARLRL